jgi:pimeloyl-ACP methyl ester carboxylesterase
VGNWRNGIDVFTARPSLLLPRSLEGAIAHNAGSHFEAEWLAARGKHILDTNPDDGEYHVQVQQSFVYASNYDKWVALQAAMMKESGGWGLNVVRDWLFPMAAMLHNTSPDTLNQIRERVGSERIMVVHGDKDRMIHNKHGRNLAYNLGVGDCHLAPGSGHGIIWDNTQWIVTKLENHIREKVR